MAKQDAQNVSCLGPPDFKGRPWLRIIQTLCLKRFSNKTKSTNYSQKKALFAVEYESNLHVKV